ncbi:C-type lectin lectoxin-Thr1-like isoform X2 [Engystomops pustulosus]|uniref:C-type lectin lectoxin-Thr1-like isoform X2 n=1 Tax=Engystomops pustulosus TaxID=76066 RepID=UPI003AFB3A19
MNIHDHTRRKGNSKEDNTYVNMEDFKSKEIVTTQREMLSSKITKAAVIFLMIMFFVLVAITSVLLKNYLSMSQDVSHLKNQENIKQNFLQDIKAINKTLETMCGTCPSGWKPIGLFCYYISTDSITWYNATDECIRKGSSLVLIKTAEEMDSLTPTLGEGSYWIGLRRDKDPNEWVWLDGSMLSFSRWRTDEPNNLGGAENCVDYWNGSWNDLTCIRSRRYVCQKGCCC